MRRDNRGPFSKRSHGFAHLSFTDAKATARIVDSKGEILHAFTRTPDGQIEITVQGVSDVAVPRKIKDVTRNVATSKPAKIAG